MKRAMISNHLLLGLVLLLATRAFATNRGSLELWEQVSVNGQTLPAGSYRVKWEGNGPNVELKFLQGSKIVATLPAHMINVQHSNSQDSSLIHDNDDGSHSLLEIHFGGKKYAFALGGEQAKADSGKSEANTDPQIVGIVSTADEIDIDYAKLALSQAKDQQVRDFAQQMITDHSSVQKSVDNLAAKLNVTPADSETSNSLKTQAQQTMQKLQGLKGKEFEKAYVDNEVAYHQAVINATKTVLIPSAQNADLKSALQGAVPLFEGHLQHAQRVQSAIGENSGY